MQTMKARLLPLTGKYYGTPVEIETEEGTEFIEVWLKGNRRPSSRQLTKINMTEEEAIEDGYFCDEHYETALSFWVAQRIVDGINFNDFTGDQKIDE